MFDFALLNDIECDRLHISLGTYAAIATLSHLFTEFIFSISTHYVDIFALLLHEFIHKAIQKYDLQKI